MSDSTTVLWAELKTLVADLEKDATKNMDKHNVSAGVRVRQALRTLKKHASLLIKATLETDKSVRAERKAKKSK